MRRFHARPLVLCAAGVSFGVLFAYRLQGTPALVAACLFLCCGACALFRRRAAAGILLFSICAGAFRMLASFPVPPPEGACVLTGCIADAPRTEGGFTYATLYDAACNGDSVRGRIQIRFPAKKAKGLKCGDIISSEAALRIPQKQAGSFDARAYYLSMGITALAYSRNAPSVRAHRIDLRYRLCSLRTRIAAVLDAAFGTEAPLARALLLNDKALEAFRGIDGVEAVTPVYQQSAYIVSGNYVNMVRVYGIDMTTAERFMLTPERGVMAEDGTRLHPEVLFTDDVAAGLANKAKDWELAVDENGNALIDLLEVPVRMTFDSSSLTGEPKADTDGRALPSSNLYTLRVTGICSTLNNNFATAAFMSFDRLQEMTQANANYMGATTQTKTAEEKANGPTYDLVWVMVKNVNDVQRIVKLIRDTGLNTYSLNDMLETVRTQSRQIQGMLGALGGIAVLISAICVANTMMMSITERTREIGVLKVLGTVRSDIFKMFLSEALIVGVIGGAAGLVLRFIAKWLIPVIFASRELRCVLPWWLAVCGVVFAGAVAIAAAWMPARKATLISPNEAIRSE